MLCKLTFDEDLEILELLAFKKSSLIKSELFLGTMWGQERIELLKMDIGKTIQEINDLEDILIH